jgi:hypothetical protein
LVLDTSKSHEPCTNLILRQVYTSDSPGSFPSGTISDINDNVMHFGADGKYEIVLSRQRPASLAAEENWLALSDGPMFLVTRHYFERGFFVCVCVCVFVFVCVCVFCFAFFSCRHGLQNINFLSVLPAAMDPTITAALRATLQIAPVVALPPRPAPSDSDIAARLNLINTFVRSNSVDRRFAC